MATVLFILVVGAPPFLLGYALGSIPFGVLLTRMAGVGDLRAIGSGNIGATNVLRTGRKGLALATLVLDALKATAAVLIANQLWGSDGAIIAGFGAFIGHLFPVWLKFRGGKGVATLLGLLLGLWPLGALGFALLWLATALLSRYSSLAALVAAVGSVGIWWSLKGGGLPFWLLGAMVALLVWRHRENIARLQAGTEGRIGAKAAPSPPSEKGPAA